MINRLYAAIEISEETTSRFCDLMAAQSTTGVTTLDAADVREVFETVLPEQALKSAIEAVGFQERERELDAVRLLRARQIQLASAPRKAAVKTS